MNKFLLLPCVKQKYDDGYEGNVVSMVNASDNNFGLFFPISNENSQLINIILKDEKPDPNIIHTLSVYQAMLNSWTAGDRYLSGIILDIKYDETLEDIIAPMLIICDNSGIIDTIFDVNFVHCMMISALTLRECFVTNELLKHLLPNEELENPDNTEIIDEEKNVKFPVDRQLIDIAKDIMNGKEKDLPKPKEEKKETKPKPKPKPKTTKPRKNSPKNPPKKDL